MNKKIKRAFSLLLVVLLLAVTFSSCSLTKKESEFKESTETCAYYRYKSTSTEPEYTIPETHNGKPITELMAFSFANAEYLKVLNIGKNIEKIDVWALTNCPLLEAINVAEDNPNYKSVDGILYNKDMTTLLVYPNGKTPLQKNDKDEIIGGGSVRVPDSVKAIGENAFYLCNNLYSIEFNEGLETIGKMAFIKCGNLQEVNLPSTVKTIGEDAFSYCNSLKKLDIPSNVTEIGDYAFFSTSSVIEKITVHNTEDGIKLGDDWIPIVKDSVGEKVPVEFVGKK